MASSVSEAQVRERPSANQAEAVYSDQGVERSQRFGEGGQRRGTGGGREERKTEGEKEIAETSEASASDALMRECRKRDANSVL